ncbi:NUDIX hydrolase [Paenibacillus sp. 19GGS1-52]|uniref:NUDIX hydrolase n=1 Tax=Paenibacillus sp. 19GGS1-52 TaxID=2758563 RepID=UPI001EFAD989|nr:NUDIX hydrolase [Paenibacillus sp. 19GGS1-52]ULO05368.1 NUDIX hydrolase [Paenibacillus sp. 19GGS1-52]
MIQYVKEMRQMIGTKPLLLCGASVIITNKLGQVLMLLRSDNDCWCLPGGAMDLGELLEETARREVYEETGLQVKELELFGVFSGKELHYVYPHGDEVYIVDTVYRTSIYVGEITINSESRLYQWFEIANLPENITPPSIPIFIKLQHEHLIS